jgi:hypothetical protein
MARVPAKNRSAAQIAAGKKFAAAGRAAQSRKGAARTAKQKAATLRFAAAGRAAQAAHRAAVKAGKKTPVKAAKRAAAAPGGLVLPGTGWLCNGPAPSCAAVAVANSLLAASGVLMSDEEIGLLHCMAGGDDGATIENVLEAATAEWWKFGGRGKARLWSYTPADVDVIVAGLVVGISLPHAGHAVLTAPGGMISWGALVPFDGEPQEAWALEWMPGNAFQERFEEPV